ncbi:MAG: radical SAM protein [Desulfurellales bacterium]|nr:MAG: radical SAM protein [Desulfurellales bacterium]
MDFIRVDKVRVGFACNSSSTHSLVLLPDEISLRDELPFRYGDKSYGWGTFTLVSREAKAAYVASQLMYVAANEFGVSAYEIAEFDTDKPHMRRKAIAWINAKLREAGVDYVLDSDDQSIEYIDHQSVWSWPTDWSGTGINLEWIKGVFDHFVDNPRTAVLGGNDNGGDHPLERDHPEIKTFTLATSWMDSMVGRPEPGGNHWTLFSRIDGAKLRVRLDAYATPLDRAWAPELVDVKITDHCPYPGTRGLTCMSCYQASMPTGVHASLDDIALIAERLGKERVLEVAIGGGEPTFHPHLLEIVKLFRDQQIVPNLTTRNWRFVESDEFDAVKDLLGGVAFSVDGLADVERLRNSRMFTDDRPRFIHRPRLSAQVVMGTVSLAELEQMMRLARGEQNRNERLRWLPLTLLGFKHTGRGEPGPMHATAGWTHVARRVGRWGTNIDTALARESQYEIQALLGEMSVHTVEFSEGAFSMYVNAVNMRMSQSSYEIDGAVPFDEHWLDRFQSWEPTGFASDHIPRLV